MVGARLQQSRGYNMASAFDRVGKVVAPRWARVGSEREGGVDVWWQVDV